MKNGITWYLPYVKMTSHAREIAKKLWWIQGVAHQPIFPTIHCGPRPMLAHYGLREGHRVATISENGQTLLETVAGAIHSRSSSSRAHRKRQ